MIENHEIFCAHEEDACEKQASLEEKGYHALLKRGTAALARGPSGYMGIVFTKEGEVNCYLVKLYK